MSLVHVLETRWAPRAKRAVLQIIKNLFKFQRVEFGDPKKHKMARMSFHVHAIAIGLFKGWLTHNEVTPISFNSTIIIRNFFFEKSLHAVRVELSYHFGYI